MAGSPLFMRDVTLNLRIAGGPTRVEYECDVKLAEIVPKAGDEVTYQTLCPTGLFTSIGKTTYALHIVAVQKWDANGLASFLWDNDGAVADFQYQAHGVGVVPTVDVPGMTGQVRLVAGAYGGEVSKYAELDVTLPCVTKPSKTTAAFPALADEPASEPAVAAA